jgi:hypothetical protein
VLPCQLKMHISHAALSLHAPLSISPYIDMAGIGVAWVDEKLGKMSSLLLVGTTHGLRNSNEFRLRIRRSFFCQRVASWQLDESKQYIVLHPLICMDSVRSAYSAYSVYMYISSVHPLCKWGFGLMVSNHHQPTAVCCGSLT